MKKSLLAITLLLVILASGALAADSATVSYQVRYDRKEALAMFDMVNAFRQSDEAWYWNSSNTEKVALDRLQPYVWDEDLHRIAMQRAAEMAVIFGHTRPNGEPYYQIHLGLSGENLSGATGNTPTAVSFNRLQETEEDYQGQGHRRNMLSDRHTRMGVAFCEVNGVRYWVQVFSQKPLATPYTREAGELAQVEVSGSLIKQTASITLKPDSLSLKAGERQPLPQPVVAVKSANFWGSVTVQNPAITWVSADTGVARVEQGQLVGVKAGTVVVTATALGKSVALKVQVLAGCSHAGKTFVTTKEAGCAVPGNRRYACPACGAAWSEEIPALGHAWRSEAQAATCAREGFNKTYCSTCLETQTSQVFSPLAHQWQTRETKATCTADGFRETGCAACGALEQRETLKAFGHAWKAEGKAPTCTEAGYGREVCPSCGAIGQSGALPALGHQWKAESQAPTCTADGYKKTACLACGQIQSLETLKATSHQWVTDARAAGCETEGYRKAACSQCLAVLSGEVLKAVGHQAVTQTSPATCTASGVHRTVCERCRKLLGTESIPAAGHDFAGETVVSSATCAQEGRAVRTCRTCGFAETRTLPQTPHVRDTALQYKAPGCETAGYKREVCTSCSAVLGQTDIPPTGHDYYWQVYVDLGSLDCRSSGYDREVCRVCRDMNVYYKTGNHVPVTEVIVSPATGGTVQRSYCQHCHLTLSETPVPTP